MHHLQEPGALLIDPEASFESWANDVISLTDLNDEIRTVPYDIIPEHKLLTAILRQALEDIAREHHSGTTALSWLNNEDNFPFTASWILEHLDLNKGVVIKGLSLLTSGKTIRPRFIYDRT